MPAKKLLWKVNIFLGCLFIALAAVLYFFVLSPLKHVELPAPHAYIADEVPHLISAERIKAESPEHVWYEESANSIGSDDFTLPESMTNDNGSIGTVTIPAVGIQMNVFETDDAMEDMRKGATHFKSTSAWNGNIGLSGHNYKNQFGPLTGIVVGDTISYETSLGTRYYSVSTVQTINDDDWSYLGRTNDNRITLITCVEGADDKRLVVQGKEFSPAP